MNKKYLSLNPFPNREKSKEIENPLLVVDGEYYHLPDVKEKIVGKVGFVCQVNQKQIEYVKKYVSTTFLQIYAMRVSDLSFLLDMPSIKHLAIHWNTKVEDISPLGELTQLETLLLCDVKRVYDLSPISNLVNLTEFEFSGGVWSRNTTESLEPISYCSKLRYIDLFNLKVENDGLKPLAKCKNLETLKVSNQFKTEDYAYLSVHLPNTECELFAPYQKLKSKIGEKDIMITGTRRPLLNSSADQKRIDSYVKKFEDMQEKFRREL